jgi:hypothetical protein
LFQQSKAEEVDKMLQHIDETLNYIGDWDECHTHLQYLPSMPISVVLNTASTTIPSEISKNILQHPNPQRMVWAKVSYSDVSKGLQGKAIATTAANTAQPSTGQIQASTSKNDSNSNDSNK